MPDPLQCTFCCALLTHAGVELCQLHLDTFEAEAKRRHKCIVMARFHKSASGNWSVSTVGSLCQGNTSSEYMMAEGCRAVV